jgi:hypothetical protein
MEANRDILNAFRKLSAREQSELQRLVDEYEAACELAKGPHPGRSKHWKTRAWDLESYLKKRLRIV